MCQSKTEPCPVIQDMVQCKVESYPVIMVIQDMVQCKVESYPVIMVIPDMAQCKVESYPVIMVIPDMVQCKVESPTPLHQAWITKVEEPSPIIPDMM